MDNLQYDLMSSHTAVWFYDLKRGLEHFRFNSHDLTVFVSVHSVYPDDRCWENIRIEVFIRLIKFFK